jgi:hypothetical protein
LYRIVFNTDLCLPNQDVYKQWSEADVDEAQKQRSAGMSLPVLCGFISRTIFGSAEVSGNVKNDQ